MKRFSRVVLLILLLGGAWSQSGAYDYPFKDPYVATIIAIPTEFNPKLPEKIDDELLRFKVFPERAIPDVFWYQPEFQYSLTDYFKDLSRTSFLDYFNELLYPYSERPILHR